MNWYPITNTLKCIDKSWKTRNIYTSIASPNTFNIHRRNTQIIYILVKYEYITMNRNTCVLIHECSAYTNLNQRRKLKVQNFLS